MTRYKYKPTRRLLAEAGLVIAIGVIVLLNVGLVAAGVASFPLWVQLTNAACLGLLVLASGVERLAVALDQLAVQRDVRAKIAAGEDWVRDE